MKDEKKGRGKPCSVGLLSVLAGVFFAAGFAVAGYFYHDLFSYRNAEECAIHGTKNRWQIDACYDLYPSAHDSE